MHDLVAPPTRLKPPPSGRWIGLIDDIARMRVTAPVRRRLKATRCFFFAAYARRDIVLVQPIFDLIDGEGHLLWIDRIDLSPQGLRAADLAAAIRASKAVLVFCSAATYASPNIYGEIAAAARMCKPLLPILIDDAPIPDSFAFYLADHQAVSLADRDWRRSLRSALDALSKGRRRWREPARKHAGYPATLVMG